MRIYFIGYIESGKRKWAERLSRELSFNFLDVRDLMEEKTGKTYAELLEDKDLYIKTEQDILAEISSLPDDTVIAVSEMLPCRSDNMDVLNKTGKTVYLRAGLGCIMMRVSKLKNDIPLLRKVPPDMVPDFIHGELNRRKVYYEKAQIDVLARELTMTKLKALLKL